MKKLFKIGLMICLSLVTTSAFAASFFNVDGIYYSVTTGSDSIPTVAVTYNQNYSSGSSYSSYSGDITIPASVVYNGTTYSVTSIGSYAFSYDSNVTSVAMPEGLKKIHNYAFRDCDKLKDMDFPSTIESISNYAFYDCDSLKSVILPEKMSSIGTYAFGGCGKLETVLLPDSLSVISEYTFTSCPNLQEITLPAKLKSIGDYAFYNCYSLKKITALGVTPPTIASNTLSGVPANIFIYVPKGSAQNYSANDYWNDRVIIEGTAPTKVEVNVATAGDLGNQLLNKVEYLDCINELTITGTLNSNDYYQIKSSTPNLIKIDMSGVKMTALPEDFFNGRVRLREIILPATLTTIGKNAMRACRRLKSIVVPDGVTSLGDYAFYECDSLETAQLSRSLKTIGTYAFAYSEKLKSIVIPDSVTSLGSYSFYCCTGLTTASIGDGIKSIANNAFCGCTGLKNVKLPQYLTTIGSYAFGGCSKLATIEFPCTLTSLGDYAFRDCTGLTEVALPAKLQTESRSFYNCYNIKKMTSLASVPPSCYYYNNTYYNIMYGVDKSGVVLYVPSWATNEYKLAKGWNEFSTITGIDVEEDIFIYSGTNLMIETGRCPKHNPNVTIYGGGAMEVGENNTLAINNYNQYLNITCNNNAQTKTGSRIISNSQSVTADTVKLSLNLTYNNTTNNTNRWTFISLPFDCYVKDITTDNDVRFAIRRYDGENRASVSGETSWKDMTSGMMLNAGEGYIVQLESNGTIHFQAADNTNKNKIFTNSEISHALNEYDSEYAHNRSWNFIGNPYGTYYDIRFLNYDSPLTVYNGNGYTAYSPLDDAYILSPMEGFFVQKPAGESAITFNPDGRQIDTAVRDLTAATTMSMTTSDLSRKLYDLTLTDADGAKDMTRVVLNQEMTMDYDMSCDASKFMSENASASQLYTHYNSVQYAINELPMSDGNINLGYYVGKDGEYTISLSRATSNKALYLIDKKTNSSTRLDIVGNYTFTAEAGSDDSRFVLSFNDISGIEDVENIDSSVIGGNSSIIVKTEIGREVKVYNISGQMVTFATANDTETIMNVAPGCYVVTVGQNVYKTIVR